MEEFIFKKRKDTSFSDRNKGNGGGDILRQGKRKLRWEPNLMPSAATWMDLEIIILSEVSQTEKDEYHTAPLICRNLKK